VELEDFNKIWKMVEFEVSRFKDEFDNAIIYNEFVKNNVFNRYGIHLNYCKDRFMARSQLNDKEIICDRHKLAAAFMISILECSPIVVDPELRFADPDTKWMFNETIAIRVGISVLFQFTLRDVEGKLKDKTLNESESSFYRYYLGCLEKADILYPEVHGKEVDNYVLGWKKELYYNNKYGTLSVLSIANELFLLERFNEIQWRMDFLKEKLKKTEKMCESAQTAGQ
jgi:hypothetical protein